MNIKWYNLKKEIFGPFDIRFLLIRLITKELGATSKKTDEDFDSSSREAYINFRKDTVASVWGTAIFVTSTDTFIGQKKKFLM